MKHFLRGGPRHDNARALAPSPGGIPVDLGAADQKATDLDGEGESGRRVPNFHDSFWNGHEFKNGLGPTDPAGQKCE